MTNKPTKTLPCCLPDSQEITYLMIGPRKATIGIRNLDRIFKQLKDAAVEPENVNGNELIDLVRKYNYIPRKESIEADYANALQNAYATFWKKSG